MHKIDVCWQSKDFVDLDYEIYNAYGRDDMAKYKSELYKNTIGNYVYHLPKVMPNFVADVLEHFPYKIKTPAINKLSPGQVLPLHKDLYTKFCQIYDVSDLNMITRYIVFLENAKSGHLMQIQDNFVSNWQAGDVISWQGATSHAAFNIGYEDRYVMQITCFDKI